MGGPSASSTIKTIAEDIAILFAIKWAVGMVAAIGKVVTAIGTAGGGGTGGTGLLGSLAMVASAAALAFNAWQKAQNPATYAPEKSPEEFAFLARHTRGRTTQISKFARSQKAAPAAPGPSFLQSPLGWMGHRLGLDGGAPGAHRQRLPRPRRQISTCRPIPSSAAPRSRPASPLI